MTERRETAPFKAKVMTMGNIMVAVAALETNDVAKETIINVPNKTPNVPAFSNIGNMKFPISFF